MNLPPTMTVGELKDWLMQDLTGLDREAFEPIADGIATKIFADRGCRRSLLTPVAIAHGRLALLQLEGH